MTSSFDSGKKRRRIALRCFFFIFECARPFVLSSFRSPSSFSKRKVSLQLKPTMHPFRYQNIGTGDRNLFGWYRYVSLSIGTKGGREKTKQMENGSVPPFWFVSIPFLSNRKHEEGFLSEWNRSKKPVSRETWCWCLT